MAGAMAPDLLYFLILTTINRGSSHSWMGMVIFCIPAGIAFSFAFHYLFKKQFISILPSPFDRKLSGLANSKWFPANFNEWLIFIISVCIGVLSHFFWDSFTHVEGELVVQFPILSEKIMLLGHNMYYARVLQHLSTILGALTVFGFIMSGNIIPKPIVDFKSLQVGLKFRYWILGILFTVIFVAITVLFFNYFSPDKIVNSLHVIGLSSWAGFFWYIVLLTKIRKVKL
jgi:hypothetical protein